MGTGVAGERPADQRLDDGLSLVFDTISLDEAVEILGNPAVDLTLSADKPQAQIAVRLCDVAADGASLRVSYAVLNLAHRDGSAAPRPLVPGETVTFRLLLKMCGHRFPAGHRIRLAVSTSYWPLVWPARDLATVTIQPAASRVALPVRQGRDAAPVLFGAPQHGPPAPQTKVADGRIERQVSFDLLSGTATYVTIGEGGLFGEGMIRWDEIGTILSHDLTRRLSVTADDPLSATSTVAQTYRVLRDGFGAIRIETTMRLTGDAEHFTLTGSLEAYEGDALVRRRDWREVIRRECL